MSICRTPLKSDGVNVRVFELTVLGFHKLERESDNPLLLVKVLSKGLEVVMLV